MPDEDLLHQRMQMGSCYEDKAYSTPGKNTDKKENSIFLINKEI